MNTICSIFNKKKNLKKGIQTFYNHLLVLCLFGVLNSFAQSNQNFIQGKDTLIVYKDVPGLAPSEFYTIRVRSAATQNKWVDCFANITRNRGYDLPEIPMTSGKVIKVVVQHYQKFTRGWSQTYGTIEMSKNSPVEVEISSKNGFKIDGKDFYKATAHPAQKSSLATVVKGKVYFTITNPAQIVIDINGQMDDFNKALDDKTVDNSYVTQTISFFANPIMDKPSKRDKGVVEVEPGQYPPTNPDTYSTLSFKPGVHDIGRNFKIYPDKNYFIPGDAIVFGTFNNVGLPSVGNLKSGENIKIYGLGTISGAKIIHPNYDPDNIGGKKDDEYKSITINNAVNAEIEGVTIVDPADRSVNINAWNDKENKSEKLTFARWVKMISWRANGDGIGAVHLIEDCFIRASDDASYMKGDRRRCTFWKDANAAVFHMAGIPDATEKAIIIEDCDVVYNRSRGVNGGGVFVQRAKGPEKQRFVNVTVRNFRVTDPRSNMPTFNLFSKDNEGFGSSYSGITFQNITIAHPIVGGRKQVLIGCAESPWKGGIIFDNVTIAGKKVTDLSEFNTNSFVLNITFK